MSNYYSLGQLRTSYFMLSQDR